jgi:hypothetical protein
VKFGLYQGCETPSNLMLCITAEVASQCGIWCYCIEEMSLTPPKKMIVLLFQPVWGLHKCLAVGFCIFDHE